MGEPYYADEQVTLWLGDSLEVLRTLPAASVDWRRYVGIDLSADYLDLSLRTRFAQPGFDFDEVTA